MQRISTQKELICSYLTLYGTTIQKSPANTNYPGTTRVDGPVDPSNEFYKNAIKEIDYINVANWLTNIAGKDFTFLHPEVLDEKCSISDRTLHLHNKINTEDFKVIIVPSCKTISISNLQKISEFYRSGGTVIFTTRLPSIAAEWGLDKEVTSLILSVFPRGGKDDGEIISNRNGGKACFIPDPRSLLADP